MNNIKIQKRKRALDLEIGLGLIFMEIFCLHLTNINYTKNNLKWLKIKNKANKRKKVRECLT